jgi:hypothetical protein
MQNMLQQPSNNTRASTHGLHQHCMMSHYNTPEQPGTVLGFIKLTPKGVIFSVLFCSFSHYNKTAVTTGSTCVAAGILIMQGTAKQGVALARACLPKGQYHAVAPLQHSLHNTAGLFCHICFTAVLQEHLEPTGEVGHMCVEKQQYNM